MRSYLLLHGFSLALAALFSTAAAAGGAEPPAQPQTEAAPAEDPTPTEDGRSAEELIDAGRAASTRTESRRLHTAALRLAEAETKATPDSPKGWMNVGRANFYLQNDSAARDAFLRAADLAPTSGGPHYYLGLLHSFAGQKEQAIERLKTATTLSPQDWRMQDALAELFIEYERYEEAEEAYRQVTVLDPDSADAYFGIGVAKSALGDSDAAFTAFSKAFSLDPTSLQALWNAAQAAQVMGEYSTSKELFTKYRGQEPNDWRALGKLIQLNDALGDKPAREQSIEELLALRRGGQNESLNEATSFCRDQFVLGSAHVYAMQPFPRASRHVMYFFRVADANGKVSQTIVYGFNEETNAINAELGSSSPLYHLEGYTGNVQTLFGFYGELGYDEVKDLVIEVLDGKKKPVGGVEPAGKQKRGPQ